MARTFYILPATQIKAQGLEEGSPPGDTGAAFKDVVSVQKLRKRLPIGYQSSSSPPTTQPMTLSAESVPLRGSPRPCVFQSLSSLRSLRLGGESSEEGLRLGA